MPKVCINHLDHYYEQSGEAGPHLVFVHGAFVDASIWDAQWPYFASNYRLLRYDLRGHGRTGASGLSSYPIHTYADDLSALLDALNIPEPIILCGLSFGGSIAQAFAVRNPQRVRALVLAGTAVSIRLTLIDKLLCDFLFPRQAMLLAIHTLSVEKFVRFSLWLARRTRGRQWLSQDDTVQELMLQSMLQISNGEYQKIWDGLYRFNLLPLERITCPTLVLNGAHEPRNTFRHTRELVRRIPNTQTQVIASARHAMNIEAADLFNSQVAEFLNSRV